MCAYAEMLGLIVTGHGHFASGLTSSLELIAGDLQNYRAVDFEASDSVEDLEKKLNKAMDELKDCQGILVCSDLAGGSPFKTAVMCGYPRGNVEIVGWQQSSNADRSQYGTSICRRIGNVNQYGY